MDSAMHRIRPREGQIASLRNVSKSYRVGGTTIRALDRISLDIERGCLVAVAGPSGSGKSSLLHLLGLLDHPDEGTIRIDDAIPDRLDDDALARMRGQRIGFVFQSFNLLPVLTAIENIEYPMRLGSLDRIRRRERAAALLDAVGLADQAAHRPGELSGGQRQRVAIARALANDPRIVIADEPTASLDRVTGRGILDLFSRLRRDFGVSVVIASHDRAVVEAADIELSLADGRIERIDDHRAAPVAPPMAEPPMAEPSARRDRHAVHPAKEFPR